MFAVKLLAAVKLLLWFFLKAPESISAFSYILKYGGFFSAVVRMIDNGSLDMDLEVVNISSNISREEIMQIILDSEQTKKWLQEDTREILLN